MKRLIRRTRRGLSPRSLWPPTHNDPRIKGPQPRIITRRQREAIEKLLRWNGGHDG